MAEEYFTYQEGADYLHVTERFLKEKARKREIPVYRLGHQTFRLRRRDLDEWAERNLQPAKPKAGRK